MQLPTLALKPGAETFTGTGFFRDRLSASPRGTLRRLRRLRLCPLDTAAVCRSVAAPAKHVGDFDGTAA